MYEATGRQIYPAGALTGTIFKTTGNAFLKKVGPVQYLVLSGSVTPEGGSREFLVGEIAPIYYEPTAYRTEFRQVNTTGDSGMDKKSALIQKVQTAIRPYEKYLVAAAVLLVLDQFILKGALTNRIHELAKSLGNRCLSILDTAIAKIGGE